MTGRCPICGTSYQVATIDDLPTFPFCSARCRTIDQARWADEAYAIPVKDPIPADDSDLETEGED